MGRALCENLLVKVGENVDPECVGVEASADAWFSFFFSFRLAHILL
jgi:hypothetical protein